MTGEDLIEGYRRVYEDDRLLPGFDELADTRAAISFDVIVTGYHQVSDMTVAFHGGAKIQTAVLCSRQSTEIISRLYQTVAETFGSEKVRQFTDLPTALQWLGRADIPIELLDF